MPIDFHWSCVVARGRRARFRVWLDRYAECLIYEDAQYGVRMEVHRRAHGQPWSDEPGAWWYGKQQFYYYLIDGKRIYRSEETLRRAVERKLKSREEATDES